MTLVDQRPADNEARPGAGEVTHGGEAAGPETGEAPGPETGEAPGPETGEAPGPETGETWVALLHRPGPAAPQDGSLFADPRFGAHVQFLSRMQEAGYLVAAGPLTDEPGEGMAILRLPGDGQFETAVRLATENDLSVACGFFTVTVRPWRVILQTSPAARPALTPGQRGVT